MDMLTALHTRRSVRRFLPTPVGDDKVRVLLEAAMIAPSAGNGQPWQFVVVTDPALLQQAGDINPYGAMAKNAPLGILVCGDARLEKYPDHSFWVQDCSAAMQNLLLAVVDQGLGAVWTGLYPMQERVDGFKKLVHLPEYITPLGFAIIGYTDVEQTSKSRFREDRVHYNRWNEQLAL